jgi:hypothetical protein
MNISAKSRPVRHRCLALPARNRKPLNRHVIAATSAHGAGIENCRAAEPVATSFHRVLRVAIMKYAPRIHIVDDEPELRNTLKILLETEGYLVAEAENESRATALSLYVTGRSSSI